MSEAEDEQWIVVTKKTKNINKGSRNPKKGKIVWEMGRPIYTPENELDDVEEFRQSKAYGVNRRILESHLLQIKQKQQKSGVRIECVGLGDFIKYTKPRLQFYFLKHLLIPLVQEVFSCCPTVNSYDPVFSQDCIAEISKLGTTQNKWEQPSPQRVSIYFMPHCERFMYDKIFSNQAFCGTLVVGNSIKEYASRCALMQQKLPEGFKDKVEVIREQKLTDYKESLNDTFIYTV